MGRRRENSGAIPRYWYGGAEFLAMHKGNDRPKMFGGKPTKDDYPV